MSKIITAGTTNTQVDLMGSGTVYYDLYINGVFEDTRKVTLTDG